MKPFDAALEKLEFEKVRQRVLRYAASDAGRDMLRALAVSTDTETVRAALREVSAMKRLLESEEELPLSGIHTIRTSVQKAGVEGSLLTPRELAQIASTLPVPHGFSVRHCRNAAMPIRPSGSWLSLCSSTRSWSSTSTRPSMNLAPSGARRSGVNCRPSGGR